MEKIQTYWKESFLELVQLCKIKKDEKIIVEAQVHLVFIDTKGKPMKIPDEIYSKFKPYFCDSIKKQ